MVQKWFWFSGMLIAGLCLIMFAGANLIMRAMASGFDADQQARAAEWLRILLPYVWLVGTAGVFKVVLNSNDRFAVPALSNLLVSSAVVAFCALAAHTMGIGALAGGFLAGGAIVFLWQLLSARRFEPRLQSLAGFRRDIALPLAAGGAMVLHSVARQVDVVVDRAFASGLPDGSIAAYNYAHKLNSIPSTIVTSVLATALFPVLARMAARGNWTGALRTVRKWLTVLALLSAVPALVLVLFREQVVSIVFERGAFGNTGVEMTAAVLGVLPLMMVVSPISALFTQLLLAQRQNRVVAIIAIFTISLKICLNLFLVRTYGLVGLAAATLVASAAATVMRVFTAWKYTPAE